MLVGLAASVLALPALADGLAPQIVTDPLTGVAIEGLDAVSYFTDSEPAEGKPDYEYDWQGAPWYFANAANRDVFVKSPDVYAPQFGGHSITALAAGYLSDGNPQIYLIAAKRLYLFYSTANRDAFLAAPGPVIADATKNWLALSKTMGAATETATIPAAADTPTVP